MEEPLIKEIQLIPSDELLNELFSRYDTVVFIGHKKTTSKDCKMSFNTKGSKFTVWGMASFLSEMVKRKVMEDDEEECECDDL
jgi:hypothetical protein